ncbi:MAG: hypothetical protein VB084_01910 [Syntrophomonadaceae bacterium]|nr:hypothetical protein [Syntrophomonadaceae bacterium]
MANKQKKSNQDLIQNQDESLNLESTVNSKKPSQLKKRVNECL